ncbi:TraB/GumN family protein [Sphingomonas canadensis]|uniref:TraB/GumN family protein n=1 Tax=Sphingomonas canadensis TaxID=1219257 RepID=A0ABW3HA85_9SPHN|nr:TraB/GumN family protein [Sphingomonas canadensis]MCW3836061.1 TraB/GumN family protein [Sphingomonas canadensis]
MRALIGFLLVVAGATAAVSQGGGLPQLPYTAIPLDDQLTLSGKLVRPESEARYEDALAAEITRVRASQSYEPGPAIWKIGDADTTIYIFGTVHTLPPGFRWRSPRLESIIVRADSLLLESVETDAEREAAKTIQQSATPQRPLIERVSQPYRPKLAALQALLPPETVADMDTMPTWVAAISVGMIRDMIDGDMPSQGADDWLEKHFRATGRPVEGIEDNRQVLANIGAIPEDAQRLMLEGALEAPSRTHDEMDATAHAWARGLVGLNSPLIIMPETNDPGQVMADPLLVQRNNAWVESLIRRLEKPGTILFAAGAGHFVGRGSVLELLRGRGIRIERVQ